MNIEVDNFSRRYLNFQWAFYFDNLTPMAAGNPLSLQSEDSAGCLWWHADSAEKQVQTGGDADLVKTENCTYVLPHHSDDYWQYFCKYSASLRNEDIASEGEVPSQEALKRFFKGVQEQDSNLLNLTFKRVLKNINKQYNELEGRNIAGRRFMRNYRNLKLTLNEFERNFFALQEMYNNSSSEPHLLEATSKCLLHVQLKNLMIEQLVQERFSDSRVMEEYVNGQGVFAWRGSRLFCTSFQRYLRDTVRTFKANGDVLTLVAQRPFTGGTDGRCFLSLKVALSRLSPLWTSISLDRQGREVVIKYPSK